MTLGKLTVWLWMSLVAFFDGSILVESSEASSPLYFFDGAHSYVSFNGIMSFTILATFQRVSRVVPGGAVICHPSSGSVWLILKSGWSGVLSQGTL